MVSSLGALCHDYPDVAGRVSRLAERVSAGELHVVVLGEFKRGKSTLLNALVGEEILPTGVVPLTAVPTEIHFGRTRSTAVLTDGRRLDISTDRLGDYVTELGNPANVKGVSRVEVGTDAWLGTSKAVLVDTPGVASVNEHNTASAFAVLGESDAAILVLSADSPLSESELAILAELGRRQERVFVVVNKCDHFDDSELAEIDGFVVEHLRRHLVSWDGPYFTDARAALRRGPQAPSRGTLGVSFLKKGLEKLVTGELAALRRQAAVAEFGRLARSLDQVLQVEAAASAMDGQDLAVQLERFDAAGRTGRQSLDDHCLLLDRDAATLVDDAAERLAGAARAAAQEHFPILRDAAQSVPARHLSAELGDIIEHCIRANFEPIRRRVITELDTAWGVVASAFTERAQHGVRQLTVSASDLFRVHLPEVTQPPVTDQRERFSYLFVRVGSPTAPVEGVLHAVLPSKLARRRALHAAQQRMVEEFLKHAGRARYDMAQRVEAAKQALVVSMVAEYEHTRASLVGAAERARSLLALGDDERAARNRLREEVKALIDYGDRLAAGARPDVPRRDTDDS